jgi:SAM-dependent methyltransferase
VDCTQPDFWEERYKANRMPWDLQDVPPALLRYLQRRTDRRSVLLPGCGSGYEVKAFLEGGWEPFAIDFSPAALQRARDVLGPLGDRTRLLDFFRDDLGGPYDAVYERTFLCSLPPGRWPDYVRRTRELLQPRGELIGIFAYGDEPQPPPFLLTAATAEALFGGQFVLTQDLPIPAEESPPLFAGMERWQVWRRS